MGNQFCKYEREPLPYYEHYIHHTGINCDIEYYTGKMTPIANGKPTQIKLCKDVLESVDIESKNISRIIVNCTGMYIMDVEYPNNTDIIKNFKLCNIDFPFFLLGNKQSIFLMIYREGDSEVKITEHHREPNEQDLLLLNEKNIIINLPDSEINIRKIENEYYLLKRN